MYLWDSNIFIQVAGFPSAFESFWTDLESKFLSREIQSVSEVKREILSIKGKMRELIDSCPDLFLTPEEDELNTVGSIMTDSRFEGFIKKKNWLSGHAVADPFIVAVAKHRNAIVVTNENTNDGGSRIPAACKAFGVKSVNFDGFIQELNWRY